MLRRAMLVLIVGFSAVLLSAGPASAAPKVPQGTDFKFSVDAGELCPFGVEFTGRSSASTPDDPTATLPDGTRVLNGPAVVTVTSETGKSATYNISGPAFRSATDHLVVTGQNLILQPASLNIGDPFAIVTNGRVTFQENNPIETFSGHVAHDVCAELA